MAAALMAAAVAGCESPTDPAIRRPIELDYRRTNVLNGFCYLTPVLIAKSEVQLQEVTIIEYGRTDAKQSAQSFFGKTNVVAGDTLIGRTIRTVPTRKAVVIWTHYLQGGERKAKMNNMYCT